MPEAQKRTRQKSHSPVINGEEISMMDQNSKPNPQPLDAGYKSDVCESVKQITPSKRIGEYADSPQLRNASAQSPLTKMAASLDHQPAKVIQRPPSSGDQTVFSLSGVEPRQVDYKRNRKCDSMIPSGKAKEGAAKRSVEEASIEPETAIDHREENTQHETNSEEPDGQDHGPAITTEDCNTSRSATVHVHHVRQGSQHSQTQNPSENLHELNPVKQLQILRITQDEESEKDEASKPTATQIVQEPEIERFPTGNTLFKFAPPGIVLETQGSASEIMASEAADFEGPSGVLHRSSLVPPEALDERSSICPVVSEDYDCTGSSRSSSPAGSDVSSSIGEKKKTHQKLLAAVAEVDLLGTLMKKSRKNRQSHAYLERRVQKLERENFEIRREREENNLSLVSDLRFAQEQHATSEQMIEEFKQRYRKIKSWASSMKSEQDSLKQGTGKLSGAIRVLLNERDHISASLNEVRQESARAGQKLTELRSGLRDAFSQMSGMTQAVQVSQAEALAVSEHLKSERQRSARLETHIVRLQSVQERMNMETRYQSQDLAASLTGLKSSIIETKIDVGQIVTELPSNKKYLNVVQNIITCGTVLTARVAKIENLVKHLSENFSAFLAQGNNPTKTDWTHEEGKEMISHLEFLIKSLRPELELVEDLREKNGRLEERLVAQATIMQLAENADNASKNQKQELQEHRSEFMKLLSGTEKGKTEAANSESQMRLRWVSATNDLAAAKKKEQELSHRVVELIQQLDRLREELRQSEIKNGDLRRAVEDGRAQSTVREKTQSENISMLESELQDHQNSIEKLTADRKADQQSYVKQSKTLDIQLKKALDDVTVLGGDFEHVKSELLQQGEEMTRKNAEIERLQQSLEAAESVQVTNDSQMTKLKTSCAKLEIEVENLQSCLSDVKAQNEFLEKIRIDIQDKDKLIAELNERLTGATQRSEDLEMTRRELESKNLEILNLNNLIEELSEVPKSLVIPVTFPRELTDYDVGDEIPLLLEELPLTPAHAVNQAMNNKDEPPAERQMQGFQGVQKTANRSGIQDLNGAIVKQKGDADRLVAKQATAHSQSSLINTGHLQDQNLEIGTDSEAADDRIMIPESLPQHDSVMPVQNLEGLVCPHTPSLPLPPSSPLTELDSSLAESSPEPPASIDLKATSPLVLATNGKGKEHSAPTSSHRNARIAASKSKARRRSARPNTSHSDQMLLDTIESGMEEDRDKRLRPRKASIRRKDIDSMVDSAMKPSGRGVQSRCEEQTSSYFTQDREPQSIAGPPETGSMRTATPASTAKDRPQPNSAAKRKHDQDSELSQKVIAGKKLKRNPSNLDSQQFRPAFAPLDSSKAQPAPKQLGGSRSGSVVGTFAPAPTKSNRAQKPPRKGSKQEKYGRRFSTEA